MIAIDTEDTGIDFRHGTKPFFVTTCDEEGEHKFWEWDVDPLTREPSIPVEDRAALVELLDVCSIEGLIFQNCKFDIWALSRIGVTGCPWQAVHDTLIAGHLLHSSQQHDLTSMVREWLSPDLARDMTGLEEELKIACNEARRWARRDFPDWSIAKEGLPSMPSAKSGSKKDKRGVESESPWKFDTWLPRALARECSFKASHPWWTVLRDYSNADSAATMELWKVQRAEIERRGQWDIYLERMKLPPILFEMEGWGLTGSRSRRAELTRAFKTDSLLARRTCKAIAKKRGFDLELPKNGVNGSLRKFVFEVLKLEHVKNPKAKTEAPSLDAKNAIPHYLATLPHGSDELRFIEALVGGRAKDTGLSYMESYERFELPTEDEDTFLLPTGINQTGTDTLRMSMSNPNLQQVSKKEASNLRYVFGPEPGWEWYALDAQNIELRLPAFESGEPELIELFEHPERPPFYGSVHLLNFSTVYADVWEEEMRAVGFDKVGPHCKEKYDATLYHNSKGGGLAGQYGAVFKADGTGTVDRVFGRPGAHAKLKQRLGKLEALAKRWIAMANRQGFVTTMPDRTIGNLGYPLRCRQSEWGGIAPTTPLNYHVQGTAMWWMSKAMVRCHEQLRRWRVTGFLAKMLLQVHDELLFAFRKLASPVDDPGRSNLGRVRILKRLMEQGGEDIGVPTPVSIKWHPNNWATGITLK